MSATAASPVRGALSPLSYSVFRAIWIASVVSNVGTWMQSVGAAWLMTSLAPSPLLVALVQTATSLPVFLLGVPAGAFADLMDRRRLLLWTQSWMLGAAALLGIFTVLHWTGPWTLLWLTFALGLGATMNGPAWQAIVPELVPREELPAAISLNSVGFNLARSVGPALGGLVVALTNPGFAFLLNAVSFVGVLIVLYSWKRPRPEHVAGAESVGSAIWAGIRYVRFAPALHSVLIRSGAFVLSASALWSIMPSLTRAELHGGSTSYGILLGCLGAGSIAGAAILSKYRATSPADLIVTFGIILFALANFALSWLDHFASVCLVMFIAGIAWLAVMSSLNIAAQTALPNWVRARGLAVYLLIFQGGMALGGALWGAVAERWGIRTCFFVAACTMLVGMTATVRFRFPEASELDLRPSLHWPEPALVVDPKPSDGPVLITVEYRINPETATAFTLAMQPVERIRRRDGAIRWGLFADPGVPGRYLETFLVESWGEHLRQHSRTMMSDRALEQRAWAFHLGGAPPKVSHWVSAGE